jgi:hypothetical protein
VNSTPEALEPKFEAVGLALDQRSGHRQIEHALRRRVGWRGIGGVVLRRDRIDLEPIDSRRQSVAHEPVGRIDHVLIPTPECAQIDAVSEDGTKTPVPLDLVSGLLVKGRCSP